MLTKFTSTLLETSWLCGVMVNALGLQLKRSWVWLPAVLLSGNNLGQVVHTYAHHQAV